MHISIDQFCLCMYIFSYVGITTVDRLQFWKAQSDIATTEVERKTLRRARLTIYKNRWKGYYATLQKSYIGINNAPPYPNLSYKPY